MWNDYAAKSPIFSYKFHTAQDYEKPCSGIRASWKLFESQSITFLCVQSVTMEMLLNAFQLIFSPITEFHI